MKTLEQVINDQSLSKKEAKQMLREVADQLKNDDDNSQMFADTLLSIQQTQGKMLEVLQALLDKEMPEMIVPSTIQVIEQNPIEEVKVSNLPELKSVLKIPTVQDVKSLYNSWMVMIQKGWETTVFPSRLEKGDPLKPQYFVLVDEQGRPIDLTKLSQPVALGAVGQKMRRSGSGAQVHNETPTGTINGVNKVFTLAFNPTQGSLKLYVGGSRQKAGGEDFTLSAGTITFVNAPPSGSIILADYTI